MKKRINTLERRDPMSILNSPSPETDYMITCPEFVYIHISDRFITATQYQCIKNAKIGIGLCFRLIDN